MNKANKYTRGSRWHSRGQRFVFGERLFHPTLRRNHHGLLDPFLTVPVRILQTTGDGIQKPPVDIRQQIILTSIVVVEGSPVDACFRTQFPDGDGMNGFELQQLQKSCLQQLLRQHDPLVFFLLQRKYPPIRHISFSCRLCIRHLLNIIVLSLLLSK